MLKNKPRTSSGVAKKAASLLKHSSSKNIKSVAGGALGNRRRFS